MMGKLNYFIGLLKRFDMDNCKEISTQIRSSTYVDQDESGVSIDITR